MRQSPWRAAAATTKAALILLLGAQVIAELERCTLGNSEEGAAGFET
ncbi:MAG: hypothetical protein P8Y27_19160 [Chromatiaceae bacterium]